MKGIILVSPKLGIGGIQRSVTNLANWLTAKGYCVYLISCKKEPLFYPLDGRVKVIVPNFDYNIKLGKLFYYLKLILYLRKQIKGIEAKDVFSFGEAFNPFVVISSINLKKKIFIADRTSPDYKHSKIISFLRKVCYPMSDALILQSSKSYDFNKNLFHGIKLVVIPNFVKKIDSTYSIDSKSILYVGRFAWEKAPNRLIESFAKLPKGHNFHLDMCGDGPMLDSMKELAAQLKVADSVHFHGKIEDVHEFYRKASIYVLPSILEGFPNAFLEALSAGLPSICYDSIPYQDIGMPSKNFIVIGRCFDFLEDALSFLIKDHEARIKFSTNSKIVMKNFQDDVIGNKYLKLINEN